MFIYTRDQKSKETLVNRGFELLYENGDISVFAAKSIDKYELDESLNGIQCVLSDTLTF